MKRPALSLVWLLVAFGSFAFYQSEGLVPRLQQLISGYNQERPTTNLYVHTDKNIYMPGETIWFKAYIQSTSQFQSEALYIRLVDQDKKATIEKEFPAYGTRANGDIFLPDSIKQGNYILYAYTDRMVNFDLHDVFAQKVKIVANTGDQLRATAYVSDTSALQTSKAVQILCNLTRNKVSFKGCKGTYSIQTSDGKTITNGKLVTDNLGDANINFIYPSIAVTESLTFKAVFFKDGSKAEVVLNLPAQENKLRFNIFAEGGDLIEGVRNKMLVELKDASNQPVNTTVILKEDNLKLSSFRTNKAGRATCYFIPSKSKSYSFVIERDHDTDVIPLTLPVKKSGWNIELKESGGKTAMVVRNRGAAPNATLALRTVDSIVWHKTVSVPDKDSVVVPFPGIDTAKQLLSFALFDSNGQLANERLFLTKRTEDVHIDFTLNKQSFGTKEKVIVGFKVTDSKGRPVPGNFSASVVSQKAMDEGSFKTIRSAGYGHIFPQNNLTTVFDDGQPGFNDALIGRHRINNSWADMMAYNLKGSVSLVKNPAGLVGFVKSKNSKPIKLTNLVLMGANSSKIVNLQPDGTFMVPATDLIAGEDAKNYLFLSDGFYNRYTLDFRNYAFETDDRISKMGILDEPVNYITASPKPVEPPVSLGIQLREVKIVAHTNANEISFAKLQKLEQELAPDCQDYVCQNGIFNCSIHHTGTKPVIGHVYTINGITKVYTRCYRCIPPGPSNHIEVKKIDLPRNFPLVDYEKEGLSSTQYLSTLFWNPNIDTDSNGSGKFQFYTSDLKGTFKIIIQGISSKGDKVIIGKKDFNAM